MDSVEASKVEGTVWKNNFIVKKWKHFSAEYSNFDNLMSTFLILVVMVLLLTIASPRFLTVRNVTNILTQSSVYLILAVGMTLVMTTGGIDISVGSMVGLTTCVIGGIVMGQGLPWWLGVIAGIAIGIVLGFWNGAFVVYFRVPSIIVTLGSMTMFRGLAYVFVEGRIFYNYPEEFLRIARGSVFGIPNSIWIAGLVYVCGNYFLNQTVTGRHITALGGNEEAARLAGIPVRRLRLLTFVIMGALAGIATIVYTARLGSSQATAGMGTELHTIATVVLGGTMLFGGRGLMLGSLFGVLILGFLENGLLLAGISHFWQRVILGLLFTMVVAIRASREKRQGAVS